MFFGLVVGEFAFGHDALEDAVGAIATIHELLQVGCIDGERVARPFIRGTWCLLGWLGQSPREMRGRMRAPRVLEIVAVEWWKCGTQGVLLVEVGVSVGSKVREGIHW